MSLTSFSVVPAISSPSGAAPSEQTVEETSTMATGRRPSTSSTSTPMVVLTASRLPPPSSAPGPRCATAREKSSLPVSTSQTLTRLSKPAVTTRLRSGVNATKVSAAAWPEGTTSRGLASSTVKRSAGSAMDWMGR